MKPGMVQNVVGNGMSSGATSCGKYTTSMDLIERLHAGR